MIKFSKYLAIIFLSIISCEKIHYYPDDPLPTPTQIRILAHQAGGWSDYTPNTLEAAKHGLRNYDGIEVDVQISRDNTLWLYHDSKLPTCGEYKSRIFRESSDKRIVLVDSCLGPEDNFTRLEEVFAFMADSFPNKFISIDAKAWKPVDINNLGMFGEMEKVGEVIIKLKNKYHLKHVMVESETASILKYVKRHSSNVGSYLTTFTDFERGMLIALNHGFTGLSFDMSNDNITADHIKLLHRKGLKIQLWTINDPVIYTKVLGYEPDFVQTDLSTLGVYSK